MTKRLIFKYPECNRNGCQQNRLQASDLPPFVRTAYSREYREKGMKNCTLCKKQPAADHIGFCVDCIRSMSSPGHLTALHAPLRIKAGLPVVPPKTEDGAGCRLCANECMLGRGETGFCGLRMNREGKLSTLFRPGRSLAHAYLDPLPTNCCAAWFCRGSGERGYNLAVFFYGCSFNCLFCQNSSHKMVRTAREVTEDELVARALHPDVRCICFFGGSPEPQLPFALIVAQRIADESNGKKHVCWEWNGSANPHLVEKAANLSMVTGGIVKFDLKAFHPNVQLALCGISNARVLENFRKVADITGDTDVLTATTLLVPWYIDTEEVEQLARFIAGIDPDISYSLLIFHPDYALTDLPITPKKQVEECFFAVRQHLTRVHIGNFHLLQ
jgi:pyruvate formate lyase activating enzyme